MARVTVQPGLEVNVDVDDYLWPWENPTPVLMQHGFSRNATFWRRWIPFLTETRRVYRPEVRGCGRSEAPPIGAELTTDTMAADALKVMDALGLDKVHWIGESSGGVLGVLMASKHPERIKSLTLVNTPIRVAAIAETYAFDKDSIAEALMSYGVGEWCRKSLAQRVDLDLASPELQNFYITEMDKTPREAAAAIHTAIENVNTFPLLKELKVPVLLLSGDKKKVTYDMQRQMEQEIPDVEFRVFHGFGNAIGTLAPERCAQEVISFWEKMDPIGAKARAGVASV